MNFDNLQEYPSSNFDCGASHHRVVCVHEFSLYDCAVAIGDDLFAGGRSWIWATRTRSICLPDSTGRFTGHIRLRAQHSIRCDTLVLRCGSGRAFLGTDVLHSLRKTNPWSSGCLTSKSTSISKPRRCELIEFVCLFSLRFPLYSPSSGTSVRLSNLHRSSFGCSMVRRSFVFWSCVKRNQIFLGHIGCQQRFQFCALPSPYFYRWHQSSRNRRPSTWLHSPSLPAA